MNSLHLKKSLLFCVFVFIVSVMSGYACRPIERPSAAVLVEKADIIVRAKAVKYLRNPGDLSIVRSLNEPDNATIIFDVKEILKGDYASNELILNGYLSESNDFNENEVPYNFVRRGGRGGSCSAYEYKKDAEFLLFLKKTGDKYTISWYALAPTNEQLHPENDKWIIWVRDYLKTLSN